jgi:hypothetical protein
MPGPGTTLLCNALFVLQKSNYETQDELQNDLVKELGQSYADYAGNLWEKGIRGLAELELASEEDLVEHVTIPVFMAKRLIHLAGKQLEATALSLFP